MIRYHLVAFLVCFATFIKTSKLCEIPHEQKTRVFKSLKEYQTNKLPFKFGEPGWVGSNVDFNFTIETLKRNDFNTYESQAIITLNLTDKKIKQIDEGAFNTLVCLHTLLLSKNNITILLKNNFEDLVFLEYLDLSENYIETLANQIFYKLHQLKVLNLAKNHIKTLKPLAFQNLEALKELILENNLINALPDGIFQPLISLKRLNVANNQLKDVELQKWKGLLNLTDLNLSGNALYRFELNYNLSFSELTHLNLSFNDLTELKVPVLLRYFPKIIVIDLNDNAWSCNGLNLIVQQLKNAKILLEARNDSTSSVNGIGCNMISTTPKSSTTTSNGSIWIDKEFLERYVEKKIQANNKSITDSITALETFVFFCFVIISLMISYEIYIKTDSCRNCRRRSQYLDESDAESVRLLNR